MRIKRTGTNRATKWSMAVLMVAGGVAILGCNKDENGKTPGQRAADATGNAVDKTNDTIKSAANTVSAGAQGISADKLENIRDVVADVVNEAMSTNDFKTLASNFPDDREKKIVETKPDTKDLDDLVDTISKQWKDKYNTGFKVKDLNMAYPSSFMTLSLETPATTAPSDKVIDNGAHRRATATLAASHGLDSLTVPFVEESAKWKLDVPDSVDGPKLHDELKSALTDISADPTKWPADETDAYRFATHHILMAVMGK